MSRPAVVFGDVHGEDRILENLIHIVRKKFGSEVDIYSLGDLVDRGPNSAGVIEICIREGVQGILGNHELWLHRYLAEGTFDSMALHAAMKGDVTLLSYGCTSRIPSQIEKDLKGLIPDTHKEFILSLPVWRKLVVEGVTYRLIHGGLKKGDALAFMADAELLCAKESGLNLDDALCEVVAAIQPSVMLWTAPDIRRLNEESNLWEFEEGVQIFGHLPLKTPASTSKYIGMDTGCGTCPPYRLSAIVLPSREIISVDTLTGKFGDKTFSNFSM